MEIKVIHIKNDALLGRYPHEEIKRQFALLSVDYIFEEFLPRDIWKQPRQLAQYCNQNNISWVFWNWEKLDPKIYQELYESERKFKIALFGHEQPQALANLRQVSKYADFTITSSPVYANEVNGFLPFGIHTYYFQQERLPFEKKIDRILISGSYRHSRGQFFEWALKEQPFTWPVYLYAPPLEENCVEVDKMREIASRYPKYVYKAAESRKKYISGLLSHLNTHKLFLDFTTNSTNYLKFHEDFLEIMEKSKTLYGGYCPERVLDALWLQTYSWCLYDKAVLNVLQDQVGIYSDLKELVTQVNQTIENQERLKEKALQASIFVERYKTERIIEALANLFKTGEFPHI